MSNLKLVAAVIIPVFVALFIVKTAAFATL